eukprot:3028967-Pyramimonas_sp.AAC.1
MRPHRNLRRILDLGARTPRNSRRTVATVHVPWHVPWRVPMGTLRGASLGASLGTSAGTFRGVSLMA